jgi:hypothetical protein
MLLLGPRQVGKSTLILNLGPDLTINLNDDKTYLDFTSNPNELRERLDAHGGIGSVPGLCYPSASESKKINGMANVRLSTNPR